MGYPAVTLGITLGPATYQALLETTGALAALRSGISSASGGLASADAIYFVSLHTYSTGLTTLFPYDSAINMLEKVVNNTDDIIDGLGPSSWTSASRRSLLLLGNGEVNATAAHRRRSRRLELTLVPPTTQPPNSTTGDASSSEIYLSMNLLLATSVQANLAKANLAAIEDLNPYLTAAASLLAAHLGVAGVAAGLDKASLSVVSVLYKKTFWQLMWDYFLRNIRLVLGCAISLAACLTLYGAWRCTRKRREGTQCVGGGKCGVRVKPKKHPKHAILQDTKPPFTGFDNVDESQPLDATLALPQITSALDKNASPGDVPLLTSRPLFASWASPSSQPDGPDDTSAPHVGNTPTPRRVSFQPAVPRQAWVAPPEALRIASFVPVGGLQLGDWSLVDRLSASDSPSQDPSAVAIPGAILSPSTPNSFDADDIPLDTTSRTLLVLPPDTTRDSIDNFLDENF